VKTLGCQLVKRGDQLLFHVLHVPLNEFDGLDSSQESLTKLSQESLTKKHLTKNTLYKNYWLSMSKNFQIFKLAARDYDFWVLFSLSLLMLSRSPLKTLKNFRK
jgi:hypothetical protein